MFITKSNYDASPELEYFGAGDREDRLKDRLHWHPPGDHTSAVDTHSHAGACTRWKLGISRWQPDYNVGSANTANTTVTQAEHEHAGDREAAWAAETLQVLHEQGLESAVPVEIDSNHAHCEPATLVRALCHRRQPPPSPLKLLPPLLLLFIYPRGQMLPAPHSPHLPSLRRHRRAVLTVYTCSDSPRHELTALRRAPAPTHSFVTVCSCGSSSRH